MQFDRVPGVSCSEPATYRVEAFKPGHASLDMVVYACREHAEQAQKKWTGELWAYTQDDPIPGKVCGDRTDFRDPKPQDVEPETQDVGEMGLLEPMPYRLKVNGAVAMRGTLQEVRAAVAHLITEWLAEDPETLALDAQTVNLAFNTGAVQDALDDRGEWYTVVGSHSEHANRIKVEREA